MIKIKT